jgi:hypothetical protein
MSRRRGAGYKPVKNCISVIPSGCAINHNYFTPNLSGVTHCGCMEREIKVIWKPYGRGNLTAFSLHCAVNTVAAGVSPSIC